MKFERGNDHHGILTQLGVTCSLIALFGWVLGTAWNYTTPSVGYVPTAQRLVVIAPSTLSLTVEGSFDYDQRQPAATTKWYVLDRLKPHVQDTEGSRSWSVELPPSVKAVSIRVGTPGQAPGWFTNR